MFDDASVTMMILALLALGIIITVDTLDCWSTRHLIQNDVVKNDISRLIVGYQLSVGGTASIFTGIMLNLVAWWEFPALVALLCQLIMLALCLHVSRELHYRLDNYLYRHVSLTSTYG